MEKNVFSKYSIRKSIFYKRKKISCLRRKLYGMADACCIFLNSAGETSSKPWKEKELILLRTIEHPVSHNPTVNRTKKKGIFEILYSPFNWVHFGTHLFIFRLPISIIFQSIRQLNTKTDVPHDWNGFVLIFERFHLVPPSPPSSCSSFYEWFILETRWTYELSGFTAETSDRHESASPWIHFFWKPKLISLLRTQNSMCFTCILYGFRRDYDLFILHHLDRTIVPPVANGNWP